MWEYRAVVTRWLDGDTCDATIDLGFHVHVKVRLRLVGTKGGVDTHEKSSPNPALREMAYKAHARSEQLVPAGQTVTVQTSKDTPSGGFDRYLAQVITLQGVNVGDLLLSEKLAVPYKR